jgi:hypothetical protein
MRYAKQQEFKLIPIWQEGINLLSKLQLTPRLRENIKTRREDEDKDS